MENESSFISTYLRVLYTNFGVCSDAVESNHHVNLFWEDVWRGDAGGAESAVRAVRAVSAVGTVGAVELWLAGICIVVELQVNGVWIVVVNIFL